MIRPKALKLKLIRMNTRGTRTVKATSIRIPYLASLVIRLCFNYSANINKKIDI